MSEESSAETFQREDKASESAVSFTFINGYGRKGIGEFPKYARFIKPSPLRLQYYCKKSTLGQRRDEFFVTTDIAGYARFSAFLNRLVKIPPENQRKFFDFIVGDSDQKIDWPPELEKLISKTTK